MRNKKPKNLDIEQRVVSCQGTKHYCWLRNVMGDIVICEHEGHIYIYRGTWASLADFVSTLPVGSRIAIKPMDL